MKYIKLVKKAKKLRQKTFQSFIEKGEAHLGGSFSMIEALIAIFEILKKKKMINLYLANLMLHFLFVYY